MKKWKCIECGTEKTTDDAIIIFFCPSCLKEMKELKKRGSENGIY